MQAFGKENTTSGTTTLNMTHQQQSNLTHDGTKRLNSYTFLGTNNNEK